MEAVPRLSMISFELKISPDPISLSPALKQIIQTTYHENPEDYSQQCTEIDQLRVSATSRLARDFMGCSTLKKYYAQLNFLKSRFSSLADTKSVEFVWEDLYTGESLRHNDIRFEQAHVLFNIGALHSILGAIDTRQNAEGMKVSCTHFQCASWAFQQVKDQFASVLTEDCTYDLLSFQSCLMLAQAQECILEKSMADNRKNIITAKIAAQIVDYYKMALDKLSSSSASDYMGSKQVKDWKRRMDIKLQFYQCVMYLYLGSQSEEQQKWGERLCYFQAGVDKLNECLKMSKSDDGLDETLKFATDVVHGKYNAAKKDNDFVYHDKVPELASLPEVKGASLVKGIPFNPDDRDVAGPDIFSKLVPMEVHEAASLYSEEKAKMLRRIGCQVEDRNNELTHFLTSLQLDQDVLYPERNETLPESLLEKCARLSVRPTAIKDLVTSMQSLSGVALDVELSIRDIRTMLDQENEAEANFQNKFGKRPILPRLKDLPQELEKLEQAREKASQSNLALHDVMDKHLQSLRLMSEQQIDKLKAVLPSFEQMKTPDMNAVLQEMQRLMGKVEEMQSQRRQLEEDLRNQVLADDITGRIVTCQDGNTEALFQEELKKHANVEKYLEQNLSAQPNILKALTAANAKFAPVRKLVSQLKAQRQEKVNELIQACDVYEDLLLKSNKGIEFFKKLEQNVISLREKAQSSVNVNQEERDAIVGRLKPKDMPPSRPVAPKPSQMAPSAPEMSGYEPPKLKDYLPFMKDRKLKDEGSATPLSGLDPSLLKDMDPSVLAMMQKYSGGAIGSQPTVDSGSFASKQSSQSYSAASTMAGFDPSLMKDLDPGTLAMMQKYSGGVIGGAAVGVSVTAAGSTPTPERPTLRSYLQNMNRNVPPVNQNLPYSTLPTASAGQTMPSAGAGLHMPADSTGHNLPMANTGLDVPATRNGQFMPMASMATSSTGHGMPTEGVGPNVPAGNTEHNLPVASVATASTGLAMPTDSTGLNMPPGNAGFNMPTCSTGQTFPTENTGQYMTATSGGHSLPARSTGYNIPVASVGHNMPAASMGQYMPAVGTGYNVATPSTARLGYSIPPASAGQNMPPAGAGQNMPTVSAGQNMPTAGTGQQMPTGGVGPNMPTASYGHTSVSTPAVQTQFPGQPGHLPGGHHGYTHHQRNNQPSSPLTNVSRAAIAGSREASPQHRPMSNTPQSYVDGGMPFHQAVPSAVPSNVSLGYSNSVAGPPGPSQASTSYSISGLPQQRFAQPSAGMPGQNSTGQMPVSSAHLPVSYSQQNVTGSWSDPQQYQQGHGTSLQGTTQPQSGSLNQPAIQSQYSHLNNQNPSDFQSPQQMSHSHQNTIVSSQQSLMNQQRWTDPSQFRYQTPNLNVSHQGQYQPLQHDTSTFSQGGRPPIPATLPPQNQPTQGIRPSLPPGVPPQSQPTQGIRPNLPPGVPPQNQPTLGVKPNLSASVLPQSQPAQGIKPNMHPNFTPQSQPAQGIRPNLPPNVTPQSQPAQGIRPHTPTSVLQSPHPPGISPHHPDSGLHQNQPASSVTVTNFQNQPHGSQGQNQTPYYQQFNHPVQQLASYSVSQQTPQVASQSIYAYAPQPYHQVSGSSSAQQTASVDSQAGFSSSANQQMAAQQIPVGNVYPPAQQTFPGVSQAGSTSQPSQPATGFSTCQATQPVNGSNLQSTSAQSSAPSQWQPMTPIVSSVPPSSYPLTNTSTVMPSVTFKPQLQPKSSHSVAGPPSVNPSVAGHPETLVRPGSGLDQIKDIFPARASTPKSNYEALQQLDQMRPVVPQWTLPDSNVSGRSTPLAGDGSRRSSVSTKHSSTSSSPLASPAHMRKGQPSTLDGKPEDVQAMNGTSLCSRTVSMDSVKDPFDDDQVLRKFVVDVEKFEKVVDGLYKHTLSGPTPLENEWKELNADQEKVSRKFKMAIARCYSMKNRHSDIMPYDEKRVVLTTSKDDYINASHIENLTSGGPKVIAAQAPLPHTFPDFWLMVYEQGVEVITMVMNQQEASLQNSRYYPSDRSVMTHGVIELQLQNTNSNNVFTERHINMTHKPTNRTRTVVHLQFSAWPVGTVPDNPAQLLVFVSEVMHYYHQQRVLSKPVLVHCSNGVGRTGVFCVVYAGVHEINAANGIIDIGKMVSWLRQQRKHMVEDKDQLTLCYKAVLYYAKDLLIKRGILTNKASFGDKLPGPGEKHVGQPSEDFIAGTLGNLYSIQHSVAKMGLGTQSWEEKVPQVPKEGVGDAHSSPVSRSLDKADTTSEFSRESMSTNLGPVNEPKKHVSTMDEGCLRSESPRSMDSQLAANDFIPQSLAELQHPSTFKLDDDTKPKRISKYDFMKQSGGLSESAKDPSDPLSMLDPLWTVKK